MTRAHNFQDASLSRAAEALPIARARGLCTGMRRCDREPRSEERRHTQHRSAREVVIGDVGGRPRQHPRRASSVCRQVESVMIAV